MSIALDIYQAFKDDETKARALAEAFDRLEQRIPADVATQDQLETVRLELKRDIQELRVEIERIRADLTAEIGRVRADLATEIERIRADLTTEIEKIRANLTTEIGSVRTDVARTHAATLRWVTGLLIAQAGVIVTLIKLLP